MRLLRTILVLAVLAFLVVDLGSPLVVRTQLDGTANDAAQAAADAITRTHDIASARVAADEVARADDAGVDQFTVEGAKVRVRLTKDAPTLLLGRLDKADSWYHVRAKATAVAQP